MVLLHLIPGVLTQQGYERDPRHASQRILFLVGYVFGMVVFCGFSANIFSVLSASRSLNNFQELINYNPIEIAVTHFKYFQVSFRIQLKGITCII